MTPLGILAATLAAWLAGVDAPAFVEPEPRLEVHIGPSEDLEAVDLRVIGRARSSIDLAAYVLTDKAVIAALDERAAASVVERIYLDPSELRQAQYDAAFVTLAKMPGVEARTKPMGVLMNLKFMVVDGALLRTGSANMSWSGLTRQDNDIVVIADAPAARRYSEAFERMWGWPDNSRFGGRGR